jgi:hypothetical protein
MTDLTNPSADVSCWSTWINATYHSLFQHTKARPWLTFARCIDHAARVALANPHYTDRERAEEARSLFRLDYPDLDAKLDDRIVEATVTAWRTQRRHWQAIHSAVLLFLTSPPSARSMAQQWQRFPHLGPPLREDFER